MNNKRSCIHLIRSATISDDGQYRYRLERDLEVGRGIVAFILVNPSTADDRTDDATVRKLIGFTARLGQRRILVGNKFAFRSTDVTDLADALDPVGPQNDWHLEQLMRDADIHIVAWGRLGKLPTPLRSRWLDVVGIAERVGCPLYCLDHSVDGHPKHPLMLSYTRQLRRWSPPP